MSFFLGLGALITLWVGSREVINGRITVGQFVAFNSYLTMLSWPVIAFGWVTNMLQRGMASWKRMLEVLETKPAIADTVRLKADTTYDDGPRTVSARRATPRIDPFSAVDPGRLRGEIEFRDLVFAYGDHARPRSHLGANRGRADGRDRRPDRLRQVDADQPAGAPARAAARHGVHRRRRRARHPAVGPPRRDRLRAAGAVSLLGHARRQRGVRAGRDHRALVAGAGSGPVRGRWRERLRAASSTRRRSPGSTRTSPTFPRATTRWSASAASRCRAARSSAPPSPAPSSSIRRS